MHKIEPTVFKITKEEVEEMVDEMIEEEILDTNLKLNREQIVTVLMYVECDEFLAKEICTAIRSSIFEVLDN